MNFLPDVYVRVRCVRANAITASVGDPLQRQEHRDVLDMTVEEALAFLANIPSIYNKMKTLNDVGLSTCAGSTRTTLSGGEPSVSNCRRSLRAVLQVAPCTFWMSDHRFAFADVDRLPRCCRFVDAGNSIVVIEHNLEVIKSAIGLSTWARVANAGGQVIAQGTPEDVAEDEQSLTATFFETHVY